MSLSKAIVNLSDAFEAVARAIEMEMPEVWNRAGEIIPDERDRVQFFMQPIVGYNGQSLLDIAQHASGKQAALDYIGHVEYGGYA